MTSDAAPPTMARATRQGLVGVPTVSVTRAFAHAQRTWRLTDVVVQLLEPPVDVLAREVTGPSRAAGLPTVDRPKGGFAASPSWDATASTKEPPTLATVAATVTMTAQNATTG